MKGPPSPEMKGYSIFSPMFAGQKNLRMKYLVLDRDGTLVRHIPYLHDPSQVEVLPTVVEGLTKLVHSGYRLFLHTNQSGIGRGYFSLEDALACNEAMLKLIGMGQDLFEDVCICPETPKQPVAFRKPSPIFGRSILAKYGVDASQMAYIGDNSSDLMTAKNIGCLGIGIDTGLHDLRQLLRDEGLEGQFPVFDTFLAASEHVIELGQALK
jgi:D-glycero-D-manno-heptose 1,7-bisphosphate phosphatase